MEIRRTASWRLDGGSPTLALNAPSKTLGLLCGWGSAESSPAEVMAIWKVPLSERLWLGQLNSVH
jgi:hypothetical protein